MQPEPLEFLLLSMDEPAASWDGIEIGAWPAGRFERLRDLGLLSPGPVATHVVCPNCDAGHIELVRHHHGQAFIPCIEGAVVSVNPDLLRTWLPDRRKVGELLRRAMHFGGRHPEVVPGRMWELGGVTWEGVKRKVVFAVGLHWADGPQSAQVLGLGGKPVVLVPSTIPDRVIWPGLVPPVVALTDVLEDGDPLGVDRNAMLAAIREADELNRASREGVLTDPKLKKAVDVAVRSHLIDYLDKDVLVEAYKAHGSYRKAAAELSRERDHPVSKDAVRRAVLAAGSSADVGRTESSASVRRVASQRRDRPKKM